VETSKWQSPNSETVFYFFFALLHLIFYLIMSSSPASSILSRKERRRQARDIILRRTNSRARANTNAASDVTSNENINLLSNATSSTSSSFIAGTPISTIDNNSSNNDINNGWSNLGFKVQPVLSIPGRNYDNLVRGAEFTIPRLTGISPTLVFDFKRRYLAYKTTGTPLPLSALIDPPILSYIHFAINTDVTDTNIAQFLDHVLDRLATGQDIPTALRNVTWPQTNLITNTNVARFMSFWTNILDQLTLHGLNQHIVKIQFRKDIFKWILDVIPTPLAQAIRAERQGQFDVAPSLRELHDLILAEAVEADKRENKGLHTIIARSKVQVHSQVTHASPRQPHPHAAAYRHSRSSPQAAMIQDEESDSQQFAREDEEEEVDLLEVNAIVKQKTPNLERTTKCYACQGPHHILVCPEWIEFQKFKKQKTTPQINSVDKPLEVKGVIGGMECIVGLDSGASANVMGKSLAQQILFNSDLQIAPTNGKKVTLADTSISLRIIGILKTDVILIRSVGEFLIQDVQFLVLDTPHLHKALLSHETMVSIGIDVLQSLDNVIVVATILEPAFNPENRVQPQVELDPLQEVPLPTQHELWFPAYNSLTQVEQLLVNNFKEFFSGLPETNMTIPIVCPPHEIKVKDNIEPFSCRTRHFPPGQAAYLLKHLNDLKSQGLIVPADQNTPYLSPITIVPKGTTDFRMVVDLTRLNDYVIKAPHPLPRLDQITFVLKDCLWFGKLDITQAYWQIPLHHNSQEYCAFLTQYGAFKPTRILMGSKNSASYFQSVIETIIAKAEGIISFAYQDDILVAGKTVEETLSKLKSLIKVLSMHNVQLNKMKCVLLAKELVFCGRLLTPQGIKIAPARMATLLKLTKPAVASQLLHFIAAVTYLRGSIPKLAILTAPLQLAVEMALKARSSRKKSSISHAVLEWTPEMEKAFEDVRRAIMDAVTLAYPDLNKRVVVMSDASSVGHACCITQVDEQWVTSGKPVKEWSHELLAVNAALFAGSQVRWSIAEKEIYSVVYAVDHHEDLMYSNKGVLFVVDSTTAAFFLRAASQFDGLRVTLRDKLFRYRERFTNLQYEVLVVSSLANALSDYFSRYFGLSSPVLETPTTTLEEVLNNPGINAVLLDSPIDDSFHWPTLEIIRKAQTASVSNTSATELNLTFDHNRNLWVRGSLIFIPDIDNLRQRLLIIAHAGPSGHRMVSVAEQTLASSFWWSSWREDLHLLVKRCLHCLTNTDGSKIPRPMGQHLRGTFANEVVCVDHLCMVSKPSSKVPGWALVMRDSLTGFVLIFPVISTDAATTIDCIVEWVTIFGAPTYLISDHGSAMTSHVMASLLRTHAIKHHLVNIDVHSGNPVERTIKTILSIFKRLMSELRITDDNWSSFAPAVQRIYNNNPTARLGNKSPIEVFLHLKPQTPMASVLIAHDPIPVVSEQRLLDIVLEVSKEEPEATDTTNIQAQHIRNKKARAEKAKLPNFQIGDYVLLSRKKGPKLRPTWTGPFQISDVLTDYLLNLTHVRTGSSTVAHISRVLKFADASYEVEAPVLHQSVFYSIGNEVVEFTNARQDPISDEWQVLTTWLGVEDATWEPAEVMAKDATTLLQKFIDSNKKNKQVLRMVKALNMSD
jgi:hypothetical protein